MSINSKIPILNVCFSVGYLATKLNSIAWQYLIRNYVDRATAADQCKSCWSYVSPTFNTAIGIFSTFLIPNAKPSALFVEDFKWKMCRFDLQMGSYNVTILQLWVTKSNDSLN